MTNSVGTLEGGDIVAIFLEGCVMLQAYKILLSMSPVFL